MHRCKLPCCAYTDVPRDQQTTARYDDFVNDVNQDHYFSFGSREDGDDGDEDSYYYSSSDEEEEELITPIDFDDEELLHHDSFDELDTYLASCQERFMMRDKINTFYSVVGNSIIGNDRDKTAFYYTQQQQYEKTERLTDLIDALQYNVKKMKLLTTMMPVSTLDQRLKQ